MTSISEDDVLVAVWVGPSYMYICSFVWLFAGSMNKLLRI